MTNLAVLLGALFFLTCLVFVIMHSLSIRRVSLLDWSVLSMGGVYGIGWCVVAKVTEAGGNPNWENWLLPCKALYHVHTIFALVLLGAVWFGWLAFGSFKNTHRRVIPRTYSGNDISQLLKAMWFLLIISFITQWYYVQAYGGFFDILTYSRAIRSGIFPIKNQFSFLKPFGGLALFASYGFFGLLLAQYRHKTVWVGLILSILFSLYILYSWMGRIGFLTYLITFVLGAFLYRKPRPLTLLLFGSIAMFIMLLGAYSVSIWFNLKPADNLAFFLARELSFPFGSFFGQLDFGGNMFRWFKDILIAPVYLLPSSLWSNWVDNVGQVNTALIMGAPKGVRGVTGAVPVDLLTLGFMQASVFGVAVVGFLFGGFLRFIHYLLDKVVNPGLRAVFEAHVAIKIAVLGVFYAQPSLFVSGNFALFITVLVIMLFLKTPRIIKSRKLKIGDNWGRS
jgi:hypothetical protein